eukprot:gene16366-34195_t
MAPKLQCSNEQRERIVGDLIHGSSMKVVSEIHGVPYRTIARIWKRFQEDGSSAVMKRGGLRHRKLTDLEILGVQELIDGDCTRTLEDIQQDILAILGIEVSLQTVSNYIKSFCYTLNVFIILDQSFKVSSRVSYARSAANTPVIQQVPVLEFNDSNVVFGHFIDNLAHQRYVNGLPSDSIIVMDNVGFHQHDNVAELMELTEYFFSKWKEYIKREKPNTFDEINIAINSIKEVITIEDIEGYLKKKSYLK